MKTTHLYSGAFAALATFVTATTVQAQPVSGFDPVLVSESGYTLFFLGFALLGLALFNLRRRT